MPKPFDATTKELVEQHPGDWLDYLGIPHEEVEVISAEVSTVTASADRVIRTRGPNPTLYHVEFQSGYDGDLESRDLLYSVVLYRRHRLPVETVVVLLRPEADGPAMKGRIQLYRRDGRCYLDFHYDVIRAWEKPVEQVLSGGLWALPMAPLADITEQQLPGVIRRMEERISQEASPDDGGVLWAATYVLMGLRYSKEVTIPLLQGVRAMKESVTYQAIVEEGRVAEAQAILLRQGNKRFGPPSPSIRTTVEGITEIDRLESLSERLLDVESWDELLADDATP